MNLIKKIYYKLIVIKYIQLNRFITRSIYSLPMVSQHDLSRKTIKLKDYCIHVESFPTNKDKEIINKNIYLILQKSEIVKRNPPIFLNEQEISKFKKSTEFFQYGYSEFRVPDAFLACIHSAKIYGQDFLVLSKENNIFQESFLSHPPILESSGILDQIIRPPIKTIHGSYCVLGMPWAEGYYHWIIDALPRLSLIEQIDGLSSIPLLVPHKLNSFQQESLLLAGILPERIKEFNGNYWQIDRLFFPSLLSITGNSSPQAIVWLREKFLKKMATQTSSLKKRIYITRRDASVRRVLNEDEVIAYLKHEGFDIICPGDLSFAEQITIFSNANTVVAPHGAGLTNIVFSPPGTSIIEMFPDNYINGCYWDLANNCEHNYAFLTCHSHKNSDLYVSLDSLKALLNKVSII